MIDSRTDLDDANDEMMLALSLVQPMAWGIAEGGKLLENRNWPQLKAGLDGLAKLRASGFRPLRPNETFAIHASAKVKPPIGYLDTCMYATGRTVLPPASRIVSALVATAKVVDVMREDSTGDIREDDWRRLRQRFGLAHANQLRNWWSGPYALVLDDVRRLDPIGDVKGALYFWGLSVEHEKLVRAQLARAA